MSTARHDQFLEILQAAGIIDRRSRWVAGKTHFVQTGDVLDRGPDSRKALDLLRKLEREASSAGGRVHALIGNHEAMRLMADMRYVAPGEYKAFVDGGSADVRRAFIEQSPQEQRAQLEKELVPGMIEMIRAFGPKGEYGTRIRASNAVVRINGVVFLHGGISPSGRGHALQRDQPNRPPRAVRRPRKDARRAQRKPDGARRRTALVPRPRHGARHVRAAGDRDPAAQKARAIVVAHTVPKTGRITGRFGGRIFMIDTGMQPAYVPNGRASALEIRGDVFTAIYRDSREVVSGSQSNQAHDDPLKGRGMRPPFTLPIAALLVASAFAAAPLADPPSQARGAAPDVQTVADPWPDAKTLEERRKSAENRRLFEGTDPLPITITADFRAVQRDRDPKSLKTFPATVTIPTDDGGTANVPIQIRTRGHSRRCVRRATSRRCASSSPRTRSARRSSTAMGR